MSKTLPWRTLATPLDAERPQRAFDGLALRVEDAGFQRDGDAGLHVGNSTLAPSIGIGRGGRNR